MTADGSVKGFFGGNAYLAIVFLLFICLFLLRAAIGFFPGYKVELREDRQSGIEFVNLLKQEVAGHTALLRKMDIAYIAEKRARYSKEEAVILLYNRFEGVVDDHLEEQIYGLAEIEDASKKEKEKQQLRDAVRQHCLNLSDDEIALTLSPLEIKTAPQESIEQAIALATTYALTEAETPDEIDQLQNAIRDGMGSFTQALAEMRSAGNAIGELERKLADKAKETSDLLKRQREIPKRIAALREGASKINDPKEREEKLETAKQLENGLNNHVDIDERATVFYASISEHHDIVDKMVSDLLESKKLIPTTLSSNEAKSLASELKELIPAFQNILEKNKEKLAEWKHDEPIGTTTAVKAFFFGTEWQTNSSWQDVYGILPLLTGSLLIAGVSLLFAVPVALGAAIYVNQFSHHREAALLKPAIEFVQAIPSVVLGLFGVLVLAGLLKDASAHPLLSWIPGFPIQERLNVLLAALLLAFMAAPTIFTLAEDALNNVPRAYSEASLAMGATRLQTALKVVLPSAVSGIIAAVLLGFGRVIGETMVVLLVAGNKAAIPEFSSGLGVVTQPVHTMTSIIAQECGEVETGSLHYMALFMVGLILFLISLSVNSYCQRVLKKSTK